MTDPLPIRLGAAIAWLEDAQEAISKAMFHLLEYQKSLSARSELPATVEMRTDPGSAGTSLSYPGRSETRADNP
jgi:hypothetical protein